ncbi:unnamed protein product [Ilex paraguariensis]|uniref:Legume lectin domain-containing protein n=1 Tax=Ilex paraguariensis TaxID=185542 RepID=A0ABC8QN26_9AQUA
METFSTSRYFAILSFFILYLQTLTAYPYSSFSFKNFGKESNFESELALYGDAKVANDSLSVQITGSSISGAGRVMYKIPIKLGVGEPKQMLSFSTYFSFSLSPKNGDGLAFVMVPFGFPLNVFDGGSFGMLRETKMRVLGVEFDTSMDVKYGDVNGNHVGLDVDSFVSAKVSNVSPLNLVLNSGEKLQAWIDYEVGSRRFEVRLNKLGELRPVDPLLSYPIDLSRMWKEDEVFVGLSSSSGNSSQKCNVYSWSFKLRQVPHWMHSQPLDPKAFVDKTKAATLDKRSDCVLRVLAALIFGTGCGALGASVVLYMWTVFGKRRPVVPEENVVHPEVEYKKFNVVVDEAIEDGKQ